MPRPSTPCCSSRSRYIRTARSRVASSNFLGAGTRTVSLARSEPSGRLRTVQEHCPSLATKPSAAGAADPRTARDSKGRWVEPPERPTCAAPRSGSCHDGAVPRPPSRESTAPAEPPLPAASDAGHRCGQPVLGCWPGPAVTASLERARIAAAGVGRLRHRCLLLIDGASRPGTPARRDVTRPTGTKRAGWPRTRRERSRREGPQLTG